VLGCPDAVDGHAVEHQPRFRQVPDPRRVQSRDGEAAVGLLFAQPLLDQGAQRLAQGGATHSEVARQRDLAQPLAGLQITRDDGLTDRICGLLTSRPHVGRVGGWHGASVGDTRRGLKELSDNP
jgi:hypothetical protein